jgi:hypothetical protein
MQLAHTIKVDQEVAATLHIEPNHNPQAGSPARTWFLLTRSGGQIIPIEQCYCQLTVYARQTSEEPILRPPLRPIAAEQYESIPGTDIIFPEPGIYRLELQGKPKSEQSFQPFQLSFSVTVATKRVSPAAPVAAPSAVEESAAIDWAMVGGGVIVTLLALGALRWLLAAIKQYRK